MKRPILPEYVHVKVVEHHRTRPDVSKEAVVPYKWLKYNGQEKWDAFSWNEKYINKAKEIFGAITFAKIYVLEFRAVQNMAMMLKRGRELNFNIIEYAMKFPEDEIRFTNSVYY